MFFFLSHVILDLIQTFAGEILKQHFHSEDNENTDNFESVFEENSDRKIT